MAKPCDARATSSAVVHQRMRWWYGTLTAAHALRQYQKIAGHDITLSGGGDERQEGEDQSVWEGHGDAGHAQQVR